MKSDEAENCLKSGEADEFFPRRRNFKQKVRNLCRALDFFGYFFFTPSLLGKVGMGQEKSDKGQAKKFRQIKLKSVNFKDVSQRQLFKTCV